MDLVALAGSATLEDFKRAVRHPLLVPQVAARAEVAASPPGPVDISTDFESDHSTRRLVRRDGALPLVYGGDSLPPLLIQKVQANFPAMITVGRTRNNDLVINDLNVSRFHAYFVLEGQGVAMADAGSTTGTWVGHRRLEPKAPPVDVPYGTMVVLGTLPALVLTAEMYWQRVHGAA